MWVNISLDNGRVTAVLLCETRRAEAHESWLIREEEQHVEGTDETTLGSSTCRSARRRDIDRLGPGDDQCYMARRAEVYATQETIAGLIEQIEAGGAGPQTYSEIVAYFIKLGDAGEARGWIRRGLASHPDDLILLALESRLEEQPTDR